MRDPETPATFQELADRYLYWCSVGNVETAADALHSLLDSWGGAPEVQDSIIDLVVESLDNLHLEGRFEGSNDLLEHLDIGRFNSNQVT